MSRMMAIRLRSLEGIRSASCIIRRDNDLPVLVSGVVAAHLAVPF